MVCSYHCLSYKWIAFFVFGVVKIDLSTVASDLVSRFWLWGNSPRARLSRIPTLCEAHGSRSLLGSVWNSISSSLESSPPYTADALFNSFTDSTPIRVL